MEMILIAPFIGYGI